MFVCFLFLLLFFSVKQLPFVQCTTYILQYVTFPVCEHYQNLLEIVCSVENHCAVLQQLQQISPILSIPQITVGEYSTRDENDYDFNFFSLYFHAAYYVGVCKLHGRSALWYIVFKCANYDLFAP